MTRVCLDLICATSQSEPRTAKLPGLWPGRDALERLGALFEATQRQWDAAVKHCTEGIGIWQWASNDQGLAPDVVRACGGDVPTLETLEQNEGHRLGDALKVGMTSATATNSGK